MPLFGGARDISLFRTMNRELINDIIQTEVAYYKFALDETVSNIYGESNKKSYYEPLRLSCLIEKSDQEWSSDDFGPDIKQIYQYKFLKADLANINLIPEVGDLILFNNDFWEVDTFVENQYFTGKRPEHAISEDTQNFGVSLSIILNTHLSRIEKLNLIPLRGGKYPVTNIDPLTLSDNKLP
ncbi:MAG: hypothetical protein CL961_01860 [Euryarchaeota archaeon]|nr:hypothetical protein [Euryarchaeota archaeon]